MASNHGFNGRELGEIEQLIDQHRAEFLGHGMNTSGGVKPRGQRAYVPTSALAKVVEFDDSMMRVAFTDGRVLCVPIAWFPTLLAASPEQRDRCEIGGGGVGLHWPDLDEDLSIAGLMAGVDPRSA